MEDQGVNHPEHLIHGAAERQVVDELMSNHPFFIDQEEAAVSDSVFFFQDVETPRDRFVQIGDDRIGDSLDAALCLRHRKPSVVGKAAIDGTADNLGIPFLEFLQLFLKGVDLRRADKGEIEWIEEKHDVFADEIRQTEIIVEFVFHNGFGLKVRRFSSNERHFLPPRIRTAYSDRFDLGDILPHEAILLYPHSLSSCSAHLKIKEET